MSNEKAENIILRNINNRLVSAMQDILNLEPREKHNSNYNDLVAIAAVRIAECAVTRAELDMEAITTKVA